MTERLLERLAAEAGKTLSPDEVASLLTEAREHLEDSIQARIELGASRDRAEAEAVRAFGAAHAIGHEVRRREPGLDRRFLGVALALIAAVTLSNGQPTTFPWLVAVGVLHVAYIVASMGARRPQFGALGSILALMIVGTAATLAVGDVINPATGNFYNRRETPREVAALRERAAWSVTQPKTLAHGLETFRRGSVALAPNVRPTYGADGALKLRPVATHAEGLQRWRSAQAFMVRSMPALAEAQRQGADRLEAAAARPWWTALPATLTIVLRGRGLPEVAGSYLAVHLLAWSFGRLFSRRRRRGTLA